jgi:hypothetical protein
MTDDKNTLEKLKTHINSVFRTLPNKYKLTYKNSEGNQISLSNDEDVHLLLQSGQKKVRI